MNRPAGLACLILCLALAGPPMPLCAQDEKADQAVEKLSGREIQQQLRPLLAIERRFLRKLLDLTPEEEAELLKQEEQHLQDVSQKHAVAFVKLQQGTWRPEDGPADARQIVQKVLAAALASRLPEDQLTSYREEISRRAAGRRNAAARSIVVTLDENLVLTAAQREQLMESLTTNWNEAWALSLQMIQPGNEQFPEIPNDLIVPFLTDAQRKVWSSVPKIRMVNTELHVLGLPLQDFANEAEAVMPERDAKPARAK
ncbi:MAG: hypothetical protein EXS05_10830 [Planctomycetaceae bacterium]|nr:hypothetical protein [Planctomycetaceae bacterium]